MYPLQEVDAEEKGGCLIHGGRLIRTLQYLYTTLKLTHEDSSLVVFLLRFFEEHPIIIPRLSSSSVSLLTV